VVCQSNGATENARPNNGGKHRKRHMIQTDQIAWVENVKPDIGGRKSQRWKMQQLTEAEQFAVTSGRLYSDG